MKVTITFTVCAINSDGGLRFGDWPNNLSARWVHALGLDNVRVGDSVTIRTTSRRPEKK